MADQITIKGIREGLLVTLGDGGDWPTTSQALLGRIDRASDFFKGARLALGVGPRALSAADLGRHRSFPCRSREWVSIWR